MSPSCRRLLIIAPIVAGLASTSAMNAACPPKDPPDGVCPQNSVCPAGFASPVDGSTYRVPCGCSFMLVKIWGGGGNAGAQEGPVSSPTAAVGSGGGGAAGFGVIPVTPNTFFKKYPAGQPLQNGSYPGSASRFTDLDEAAGCATETETNLAIIGGGAGGGRTEELSGFEWHEGHSVGDGGAGGRAGQRGRDSQVLRLSDQAVLTAGGGSGGIPGTGGVPNPANAGLPGNQGCQYGTPGGNCLNGGGWPASSPGGYGGQGAWGGGGAAVIPYPTGAGGGGGSSVMAGFSAFAIYDGNRRQPGKADDPDYVSGVGAGGYLNGSPGHPATGFVVRGGPGNVLVRFSGTLDFGAGQLLPGARSFNGDGQTDLVLRDGSGQHVIWYMNGTTRLSQNNVSPNPSDTVAGADDFNGDGNADLVLHDPSAAPPTLDFWFMNGAARMGAPIPLTGASVLGGAWKLAATGDFNNDGQPDLVWRNTSTQKLAIWTLLDTTYAGTIIPSPDQAVDGNWSIVAALDLGPGAGPDGIRDLLWYNSSSGKIVYWTMQFSASSTVCQGQGLASPCVYRVTGAFTNPANAADANWRVVAGGDFGVGPAPGVAGSNDIVWRNSTSGRIVVWHMDFLGNRTAGVFTVPDAPSPNPAAWAVVGPK